MNVYNPLATAKRLEAEGIERKHAEAIATELGHGIEGLVTKTDLQAELNKHTLLICGVLGSIVAVAASALGVLISLH